MKNSNRLRRGTIPRKGNHGVYQRNNGSRRKILSDKVFTAAKRYDFSVKSWKAVSKIVSFWEHGPDQICVGQHVDEFSKCNFPAAP